jgi:hypothetical protein
MPLPESTAPPRTMVPVQPRAVATVVPRAMIIDQVWRQLGPGLEPLSGPDGAPLTRTIKLIILPLVVRPSSRPQLGSDLLRETEATELENVVAEHAARLRATACWFKLLKQARRQLGIVGGNPQDLYFQTCFELATDHGVPGPNADGVARRVLAELWQETDGRTVEDLKKYLNHTDQQYRVAVALATAWKARAPLPAPAPPAPPAPPETEEAADERMLVEVLDGCVGDPVPQHTALTYQRLLALRRGSRFGHEIWADSCSGGARGGSMELGLSRYRIPKCPQVGRSASTAALPAPLDRSVFERLFTVLQAPSRRFLGSGIAELVDLEVQRSCAPLGLADESLRVVVLLGARMAAGLDPFGTGQVGSAVRTAAHQAANRRWQREASVLRAKRMTTSPDPQGGTLAALAAEMRAPAAGYMRRLWVRLHGRDVHATGIPDPATAWDVLDGVSRSVIMDYRSRVRSALRALSTPTGFDPTGFDETGFNQMRSA